MTTGGVVYVPSPRAENVPRQCGLPAQRMALRDEKGPYRKTLTETASAPRPRTTTLSVIRAPGRVDWSLICVVTSGVATTTVVSATSPHFVCAGRTKPLALIHSR